MSVLTIYYHIFVVRYISTAVYGLIIFEYLSAFI
jgi:hypothetical protein